MLLYGAGCWTPLRRHLRRLDSFHHRCIRTILGITNQQQWQQRITSASTREQWGDIETAATKVAERRLEWLGHLARMQDNRMPKKVLFGWLPRTRPAYGPRRRWRDLASHDLKYLDLAGTHWYEAALSRLEWRTLCSDALEVAQDQRSRRTTPSQRQVHCRQCQRWFRREADKARHKCSQERQQPICHQRGAVQCSVCHRWFRSRGGLAVHRCTALQSPDSRPCADSSRRATGAVRSLIPSRPTSRTRLSRSSTQRTLVNQPRDIQCHQCSRWFRRPGDIARHKCITERNRSVQEQRGSVQCHRCNRWFLSHGGLGVHRCRAQSQEL